MPRVSRNQIKEERFLDRPSWRRWKERESWTWNFNLELLMSLSNGYKLQFGSQSLWPSMKSQLTIPFSASAHCQSFIQSVSVGEDWGGHTRGVRDGGQFLFTRNSRSVWNEEIKSVNESITESIEWKKNTFTPPRQVKNRIKESIIGQQQLEDKQELNCVVFMILMVRSEEGPTDFDCHAQEVHSFFHSLFLLISELIAYYLQASAVNIPLFSLLPTHFVNYKIFIRFYFLLNCIPVTGSACFANYSSLPFLHCWVHGKPC